MLCGTWAQACERYEAAWRLRQSSHSALYNWGVALSDMSRAVKANDRAASDDLLVSAADKYATSLRWNPNNPQVCPALPSCPATEQCGSWGCMQLLDRSHVCFATGLFASCLHSCSCRGPKLRQT